MTAPLDRVMEDRYLRDAARALLEADIQNIRNDLAGQGIASRAADRLRNSAVDVYDEAVSVAADNKGVLAALLAALALWLFRNPLRSLFEDEAPDEVGEGYAEGDFPPEH